MRSLSIEQARAGHDVHVAAILDLGVEDHPLFRGLASRGVRTRALPIGARQYRRERAMVREVFLDLSPDIVHTHGYRPDVLHGPVARALGIPVVATVHGFTGGDWKNRIYEHLQRRAFRRADAVVAVSGLLRDGLIAWGIRPERVHCVQNAWAESTPFVPRAEARAILGVPVDAWCAGFIGRIGHEKGPDTFVEAFLRAEMAYGSGLHALVIGDGRMREELTARVATREDGPPITFTGAIDDAGRLVAALDVLVISSRTEGTPMVLLEAMAAGVPVVTTRVGGIPDVVTDREAVLVPAEDPAMLGEAILEVRADPAGAAKRAGRAAARLESEFNAALWRERYDDVYRGCLRVPESPPVQAVDGPVVIPPH